MRLPMLAPMAMLILTALSSQLGAQPLSGTYTIANGNPGGAFDYGDLGDAFDDLEEYGLAGPTVLELYDTGGSFQSSSSYTLGIQNASPYHGIPILGLSPVNPLTIRAAAGHDPVIAGSNAHRYGTGTNGLMGTISFLDVGYTTFEGVTVTGGLDFGIHWSAGWTQASISHIRIARCNLHSIVGTAIHFGWGSANIHNVVVENNHCWDCWSNTRGIGAGVIGAYRPGFEWIFRYNTILYANDDPAPSGAFYVEQGVGQIEAEGNIAHVSGANCLFWRDGNHALSLPAHATGNVVHLTNLAAVSGYHPTWTEWQAAGFDLDGLNTDPLLVNITPGFEDLRLSAASPARDLIPSGSVVDDIFGNPRPLGARWDAGAHEYPASEIEVSYQASAIAHNGSVDVGVVPFIGSSRTFTVSSTGFGDLELSGVPPVEVNPGLNCTAATDVQSQPALTTIPPNGSTTFTLFIQPAAAGPFDLTVSIENNDIAANPFIFTVTGTAIPNGAAQADALSGFGGFTNGPFTLSLAPGEALPAAAIELTDPEGDTITVAAISPTGASPTGVVAPAIPPPGGPLTLAWSGVADAANAPGDYSWLVEFSDAGNGAPVAVTVTITIREPIIINSPSQLPDGRVGEAYSIAIQATGGAGGFTRTLTGDLPQGLTFNALNGAITGKPEIAGDYQFTVEFEDTAGSKADKLFDLKINPNPKGSPPRNEGSCHASAGVTPAMLALVLLAAALRRRRAT